MPQDLCVITGLNMVAVAPEPRLELRGSLENTCEVTGDHFLSHFSGRHFLVAEAAAPRT